MAAFVFVFGSGAIPFTPLIRGLTTPERVALASALGLVIAPTLICLFAVLRCGFLVPPLMFSAAGAAVALWREMPAPAAAPGDRRAYLWLPMLVLAATAWVSSGRMTIDGDRLSIFGDYDTLDLTFLASITSELKHTTTFPPVSPFYGGHRLIYSYYPLAFLGAVQGFTGVSMLRTFLWYGFPFFAGVASAAMYAFCRRLGSIPFAVTTTILVFTGAGFAYVAGWWWPSMVRLDPFIWSSMFLAPSAEWLPFNPWTPALAVIAAGLYAVTRIHEPDGARWIWMAAACFGLLFIVKSFAFVVAMPALALATGVWLFRRDPNWRRLAMVTIGAVVVALPWLLVILPYNRHENRGAAMSIEFLSLVRRMLFKTDLTDPLAAFVQRYIGNDPHYWILLTIASVIFLVGGMGLRWLGVVSLVRAVAGAQRMRAWTPVAWMVILGVTMPFFVAIAPFPNSIQPYMFAMYVFWPFAARVVWPPGASISAGRFAAASALIVLSLPATAHYAMITHRASSGTPLATLGPDDFEVIRILRQSRHANTVLLQSNPVWPSLYAIEAERRVALALSSYVAGDASTEVDSLIERIAAFFGSPTTTGTEDVSILKAHEVSYVIERTATDRLHPRVIEQLQLVFDGRDTRLYRVPLPLRR